MYIYIKMTEKKPCDIQNQESMWKGATISTFQKAQLLRATMTSSESLLWDELKGNKLLGYKFRRQHPIGNYIVDFYVHKLKLVIEVDGKYHEKMEQINRDKDRTAFLEFNGLKVIRFTNEEVENSIENIIEKIKAEINLTIE